MSSKFRFISAAALTIALGGLAAVSAQEPTTKDTTVDKQKVEKRERMGRHGGFRSMKGGMHRGMRGPGMMMRGMRGIELTEAQKQQIRTIMESNKPDPAAFDQLKAIREARKAGTELTAEQKDQIKAFREARAAKMKLVHEQILNVLTSEQKQQIEQRKLEMRKRMQEHRELRKAGKPVEAKPVAKPTDN
jgi:protein CpxP